MSQSEQEHIEECVQNGTDKALSMVWPYICDTDDTYLLVVNDTGEEVRFFVERLDTLVNIEKFCHVMDVEPDKVLGEQTAVTIFIRHSCWPNKTEHAACVFFRRLPDGTLEEFDGAPDTEPPTPCSEHEQRNNPTQFRG